jgi:spermidine/putrescine transport system substrate-binding protein
MNENDPRTPPYLTPALLRGLTQRRISRRQVLKIAGAGAGAAFLAACGVKGTSSNPTTTVPPSSTGTGPSPSPSGIDYSQYYGDGKPAGTLNFANWEDYIDVNSKGNSPSLEQFTKETGIKVNYKTVINDNDPFLAKIIPVLQAGQDTGYDLIVITNGGSIERLISLGYLTPLDHSFLPTWDANADPATKNPNYDPGNQYTVVWQSGFTGIAYNSKKITTPPTSFADLLNPAYKGKVGMFGNDQDLPCAAINYLGFDIDTATPDEWQQAADLVTKARDDGIILSFYDQSYINALENGETIITQAWSGDAFIAAASTDFGGDGYPEIKFVFPQEGPIYWHDNMAIPLYAKHPVDAIMYMDYVYRPEVAALMADFIWYVTPVPAAKDIVLNDIKDPTVANSPLVFPTADDLAKAKQYKVFKSPEEKDQWDAIWQPVYSS